MDLNERFEEVSAKMDELKAKAEKASREVKESWNEGIANFKSDMAFTMESINEVADEAEMKHDQKVEEHIDKIETKRDERLEKRREKVYALRDRINELAQDVSKADQEEFILDLLDYADECQATAVYMAEEAAVAYKTAAQEIVKYNEKYGR